ncbi:Nitroreductase-like protein [Zopfochytrium polystomum]|nr:Nitroreductase-like protein [Zopfochytrium polystomum]
MAATMPFLDAVKIRRSTVSLGKSTSVPDARVLELVRESLTHAPSSFSLDSCRAVVLLGDDHEKLWDIALQAMHDDKWPEQVIAAQEPKVKGHRGAHGTVLFFEDTAAVESLPPALKTVIVSHPEWAEHGNAMAQYVLWTALCAEGLGCNLQHFNPTIDAAVAAAWNVPAEWKLRAQLVFGEKLGPPRGGVDKKFKPIEPRVRVFGSAK